MNIEVSKDVDRKLRKIKRTDRKLAKKIEQKLALFQTNPQHPSLRNHKLSGSQKNLYSISITMSFRITYLLIQKDTSLFINLGTHDEVYEE